MRHILTTGDDDNDGDMVVLVHCAFYRARITLCNNLILMVFKDDAKVRASEDKRNDYREHPSLVIIEIALAKEKMQLPRV